MGKYQYLHELVEDFSEPEKIEFCLELLASLSPVSQGEILKTKIKEAYGIIKRAEYEIYEKKYGNVEKLRIRIIEDFTNIVHHHLSGSKYNLYFDVCAEMLIELAERYNVEIPQEKIEWYKREISKKKRI